LQRRLLAIAALMLIGACAARPDTPDSQASLDCSDRRPVTGSSIPKKDPCVVSVDRGQNAARSQAEALQEDQDLRNRQKTAN
jgi:hypothetical protein